jgi:lipoate-protein ligase A
MNKLVIDSGKGNPADHMAKDAQLLENLSGNDLILHFYDWELPTATYGYFTDPYTCLSRDGVQRHQLQLARRPTGGGVIFHLCDFAFSLLMPSSHPAFSVNTLENYAYVNHVVADAIQSFSNNKNAVTLLHNEPDPLDRACTNFCMAKPTQNDLMIAGRKVGGGAQRRKRQGLLHQGTISLGMISEEILNTLLLPGTQVIAAMQQHSFALLGSTFTLNELTQAKKELRHCLENSFFELL